MRENLLKYEFFFSEMMLALNFCLKESYSQHNIRGECWILLFIFFFYRVPLLSLNNPQKDF